MVDITSSETSLESSSSYESAPIVVTRDQTDILIQLMPQLTSADKKVAEEAMARLEANCDLNLDKKKLTEIIGCIKKQTNIMAQSNDEEASVELISDFSSSESSNEYQSAALTVTPPSSTVATVNKSANWPKRPARGVHSEKKYYDRRVQHGLSTRKYERRELVEANKTGELSFQLSHNQEAFRFNGYFHGVLSPSAMGLRLQNRELGIFWPAFDPSEECAIKCRLLLAYKTVQGVLHFLPLNKTVDGHWKLSEFGFKTPHFGSLSQLVGYLRDGGFVLPNKTMDEYEHVPVWKLDEKTLDACKMAES
ncbi:hypothetical protein M3Y94_01303400 [Aphelenchoides besseyi]|nr:hypothetical protein M3Y94_01303400 [Aphelenchoides besseyi]KAI6220202.1 hypothetical protein M3Y95_01059800 [Aphelenchoides besseyi]